MIHPIFIFIKRIFNIPSQISYKCKLGYKIRLPHKGDGVIISKYAEVGDNVTIYHQVTLGINENKNEIERKIIIGNDCYISVGAKIISCKLGDRVKVAPNKVIYFDCKSDVFVK
ncbi:serine acetyltransferase [Aliivibrio sifiae]|uniref:Serine acetyltransferase n=1 Tax=Aliivibrio sifiae TaxID=566293 RepID=A0A2S7X124_9GAMM|nr:serine acetyltransferase [Aliivibrio sifiae]